MEREAAVRAATKRPISERIDLMGLLAIGAFVAAGAVLALLMVPVKNDRDLRGVMLAAKELRKRRRESVRALRRTSRCVEVPNGRGRIVVSVTDPPPGAKGAAVTAVMWAGGEDGPGEPGSSPLAGGVLAGPEDSSLWGLVHASLAARAAALHRQHGLALRVVTVHRDSGGVASPSVRLASRDVAAALRAAGAPADEPVIIVGDGVGAWVGPITAAASAASAASGPPEAGSGWLGSHRRPAIAGDGSGGGALWLDGDTRDTRPRRRAAGPPLGRVTVAGCVGVCPRLLPLEVGVAAALALSRVPGGGPDAVARARDATSPPVRAGRSSGVADALAEGIRNTDAGAITVRTARTLGGLLGGDPATRSRGRTTTDGAAWSVERRAPRLSDAEARQAGAGLACLRGPKAVVAPAAAAFPLWASDEAVGEAAAEWLGSAAVWVAASDADATDLPHALAGGAVMAGARAAAARSPAGRHGADAAARGSGPPAQGAGTAQEAVASRASSAARDAVRAAAASLGVWGLEGSKAAAFERLLAAVTVGTSRDAAPMLVLGPDSAAWGRSIAADPWWRRAVRAVAGGGASAAAEAGWPGAHSLPLQAPEAVASAVQQAVIRAASAGTRGDERQRNAGPATWRPGQGRA